MIENSGEFSSLPQRVRAIRVELCVADGGEVLAKLLGVSERTIAQMEIHDRIPGHIILGFIEVTGANPSWLLSGRGERYRPIQAHGSSNTSTNTQRCVMSQTSVPRRFS